MDDETKEITDANIVDSLIEIIESSGTKIERNQLKNYLQTIIRLKNSGDQQIQVLSQQVSALKSIVKNLAAFLQ